MLQLQRAGRDERKLRCRHFSVAMSVSRRLCRFSAVNIDGQLSKKNVARPGWRTDPRIARTRRRWRREQRQDVYGNQPRFARGHMTRREDPIWGAAGRGHAGQRRLDARHERRPADAAVQRRDLAGARGLRARARARGRHEDLGVHRARSSATTIRSGSASRSRSTFWKVIAFVHDETGELCATGYTMSQETSSARRSSSSARTRPRRCRSLDRAPRRALVRAARAARPAARG